jgi:Protein of unknown function (DUF2911)
MYFNSTPTQSKLNSMKKPLLLIAVVATSFLHANAQLQLPQPSPKAQVMQAIGLTDITIDYSSPGVKGRTIWGDLVPYDKLWRAGANYATKVTFSKDVTIDGKKVPKGSYSLFIIPSKSDDWTIVLNTNATASVEEYLQDKDAIRVKSKPVAIANRERMSFQIIDFVDQNAWIAMEWEKVRVGFNVVLDTDSQALENIKSTLGGTWRTYNSAARYMMEKKDLDKATAYADQSLALSSEWFNNWTKAQILAEKKSYKEATTYAQKAKELGDKNPDGFFFKDQVEKALVDWKGK